jgi:hypothetical protein
MPLDKRESLKYRKNHGTNSTAPCGRIPVKRKATTHEQANRI